MVTLSMTLSDFNPQFHGYPTVRRRISRVQKNPGFLKKVQPSGFFWVLLGLGFIGVFLDKQEKIGKIIQKLVIYLRQ